MPEIFDSNSYSDSGVNQKSSKCLIPLLILIPIKNGIIPELIPIPESESCITGQNHL